MMNQYEKLDIVLDYLNESINNEQLLIKKNESKIKTFVNSMLKKFYNEEKDKFKSNPNYDWRRNITGLPKIQGKFNYQSSGITSIILSYPGDPSMDDVLFFESDFVKYINKSKDKILNEFRFIAEDSPNIIIKVK